MEAFPIQVEGEEAVGLRDPSGLSEQVVAMSREALFIASCMDGTRTLEEIRTGCTARFGQEIPLETVRSVAEALESALLLDSERFRAHRQAVEEAFLARATRPAAHAGAAYEGEPEALAARLDALLEEAARTAPPLPAGELVGLISPHIDLHRGGPGYGAAYLPLRGLKPRGPVVILGTAHASPEEPFVATRKGYETPLGTAVTDGAFLDRLEERYGRRLFQGEAAHRSEHSIEFQAVLLRHLWGDATPPIVPVLCSSFHQQVESGLDPSGDPVVAAFLSALRETLAEHPGALLVAAADLAHLGPRFGDGAPVEERLARWCGERDRATLEEAAGRRPEGFFREIASEGDRRRICGISAIYAFLSALPRDARGTFLHYGQALDPEKTTFVSHASMAFTAPARS